MKLSQAVKPDCAEHNTQAHATVLGPSTYCSLRSRLLTGSQKTVPPIESGLPNHYEPDEGIERNAKNSERYCRYSTRISRFITSARLRDPRLSVGNDIISVDKFEAVSRTLIYNRTGDRLAEEAKPISTIGNSFAY